MIDGVSFVAISQEISNIFSLLLTGPMGFILAPIMIASLAVISFRVWFLIGR